MMGQARQGGAVLPLERKAGHKRIHLGDRARAPLVDPAAAAALLTAHCRVGSIDAGAAAPAAALPPHRHELAAAGRAAADRTAVRGRACRAD
jgi:hypothetical protein